MRTITLFLLLLASGLIYAEADSAGIVIMARGDVSAQNSRDELVRPLSRRSPILAGDTIYTGTDSRIQIRFNDNAILALEPDSQLQIQSYQARPDSPDEPEILMNLVAGGFRTLSGQLGKLTPGAYRVDTPVGSIGIRGTLYGASIRQSSLILGVWQGRIVLNTDFGEFELGDNSPFRFAAVTSEGFSGLDKLPPALAPTNTTPGHSGSSDSHQKHNEGKQPPENEQESEHDHELPLPLEQDENSGSAEQFEQDGQIFDPDEVQEPAEQAYTPDIRLNPEEYEALFRSQVVGAVITMDDVHVGTMIQLEGAEPVLLSGTSVDDLTVLRFDGNSSNRATPLEGVDWGIWDANSTTPLRLYPVWDSLENTSIEQPALWFSGVPTRSADLGELSGNTEFALTAAIGLDNQGNQLNSASGSFTVNFDRGDISHGNLQFGYTDGSHWQADFTGDIRSTYGYNAIADIELTGGYHDAASLNLESSHIAGIFSGSEGEAFLGGFNLYDSQGGQALGAFVLEADSNSPPKQ